MRLNTLILFFFVDSTSGHSSVSSMNYEDDASVQSSNICDEDQNSAPNWQKLWVYDSNEPQKTAPLRQSHVSGIWEEGDSLLVFGGTDIDGIVLRDLWSLNLTLAYQSGSSDMMELDVSWEELPSLSEGSARSCSGGVIAPKEFTRSGHAELWVYGGSSNEIRSMSNMHIDYDELWVYDIEDRVWFKEIPENPKLTPGARSCLQAIRWNSLLIINGGRNFLLNKDFSDTWSYDFTKQAWTMLHNGIGSDVPIGRLHHAMTIVPGAGVEFGDILLMHGGATDEYGNLQLLGDVWTMELSDPQKRWVNLNWYPTLRRMCSAITSYNGKIWEFGGLFGFAITSVNSISDFDWFQTSRLITGVPAVPLSNANRILENVNDTKGFGNAEQWMEYIPFDVDSTIGARYGHSMQMWNGKLVVYGGSDGTLEGAADIWALDISLVESSQLVEADNDPSFNYSINMFSLVHVLFIIALLLLLLCICIFASSIRKHIERRNQFQLDGNFANPGSRIASESSRNHSDEGISMENLNRLPISVFGALEVSNKENVKTDVEKDGKFCEKSLLYPSCGDICVICRDSYIRGDRLRLLPCSHRFHVDCIDIWLRSRVSCPMCKQPINFEELAIMPESSIEPSSESLGASLVNMRLWSWTNHSARSSIESSRYSREHLVPSPRLNEDERLP